MNNEIQVNNIIYNNDIRISVENFIKDKIGRDCKIELYIDSETTTSLLLLTVGDNNIKIDIESSTSLDDILSIILNVIERHWPHLLI